MSLVDKVKGFLSQHRDQVDKAIDKAGDLADKKTGGKYADKIDKAQEQARKAAQANEEATRHPYRDDPRP
jgi:hypothetical protein